MKIAHVSPWIENTGGHRILYEHISRLKKAGHEIDVFASGVGYDVPPEWHSLKVKFYSEQNSSRPLLLERYDLVVANMLQGAVNCLSVPQNKVYFYQNHDPFVFKDTGQINQAYQMYEAYDKHLTYSNDLREIVLTHYPNKKIFICKNGVTYNKFKSFQKIKRNQDPKVCFMVAYPGRVKGLSLAAEVFGKLRKKGFKTVMITALGEAIPNTDEFHLNPAFEEKAKILASCDILLHTSVFETFCMVVIESMSLGVPMVGTNSRGILEYCNPDNSIVIDKRDPDLLTQEVVRLWEDKKLYSKMVKNSIKTASALDWNKIFPSIENIYKKLC